MKIIVLLVSFLEIYLITKESIKYLPTLAKVAKTRKLVKAMIKRLKKSQTFKDIQMVTLNEPDYSDIVVYGQAE